MTRYLIAIHGGELGKWVPVAYPSTPQTYRQDWNSLKRHGHHLLSFERVTHIGGTYQEADEPGQPLEVVEAWTMISNDDHYKLMGGKNP